MEGDRKRLDGQDRSEEKKTTPRQIQEYEFFVDEGSKEAGESLAEKKNRKEKKKRKDDRSKSRIFFLE